MSAPKWTPKVTPSDISHPKLNNYLDKGSNLIRQLRYVIITSAVIGINRLYLLKRDQLILWCTYSINFTMALFVLYIMSVHRANGGYIVFFETICVEFLLLIFSSIFFQRKTLENFFTNLGTFDEMLNIQKDIAELQPLKRVVYWIITCLIYCSMELILLCTYFTKGLDYTVLAASLGMLVHDTELVFICSLLRTILARVHVIKGHVVKSFEVDEKTAWEEFDKIERLSKNTQLDVASLHKAYELLHKAADELNSVMSFPIIVMLTASGLSSIMLLKNLFTAVQYNGLELEIVIVVYVIIRCLKYTILLIIPCYYSSMTTNQVSVIRTVLHDAVNTLYFDKIERRKLKAFFQLTRDNEFTYALLGVVRLNMSLPLSYTSLCTTYLVIVIQFSKFID